MKHIEASFWIVVLIVVLALNAFALVAFGQALVEPAAPPTLTEVQTLRLQNALQALEITRLRAEQAAREFEAARTAATSLVSSLQVDGFTLDLQRMAYVPAPAPEPPMP